MEITSPYFWPVFAGGLVCLTLAYVVGIRQEAKHRSIRTAGVLATVGMLGISAAVVLWFDPTQGAGNDKWLALGLLSLFLVVVAVSILFTPVGRIPAPKDEEANDADG